MTREEIIKGLEAAHQESGRYGVDEFGERAIVDRAVIWDALEIIRNSEPIVNAEWRYYVNDEGKARWRCSKCGKIIRRGAHEKKRCSVCGAHMSEEA